MRKTIWKFEADMTDEFLIQMPVNAKIISAQNQSGKICIWAIVNPENLRENRMFRVYGTGNPFNGDNVNLEFIATIQDRIFVWHLFEVI